MRLRPLHYYLFANGSWYLSWGMQSVVFAWLVTLVLREPADKVGLAQTALLLPGLFLILVAGAIADRFGPARQALWSQLLAGMTPLILIYAVLTDSFSYEILIVYALLTGIAQAFLTPARDGLLNYVAEGNVQKLVLQSSLTQFSFQIVGVVIAGFADDLGAPVILAVQVFVMLVGVWTYKQIHLMVDTKPEQGGRKRVLREVWEGGVTVFTNPIMRVVVIQNVAMALFFMGAFVVAFPLVVREVFDGTSSDLAAVSGFNALGLVATIFILLRLGYIERPGRALLLAQGLGTVFLFLSALAGNIYLFIACIFSWGLCGGLAMPMCRTIMQELAPIEQRSRVMGFFGFSFMGTGPIGALLVGYLAEYFGPQESILICSVLMLTVIVMVGLTTEIWDTRLKNEGNKAETANSDGENSASI